VLYRSLVSLLLLLLLVLLPPFCVLQALQQLAESGPVALVVFTVACACIRCQPELSAAAAVM
jgi:hypothetical protein